MRKSIIAAAAAATALVTGGAAGAALAGPSLANAQTTPSTQAPSTQAPTPGAPTPGAPVAPRHEGGRNEAVSDLSIAAKAIGIPEADLSTALASGQSLAAVAKAHSVDPQKVIDALVADARSELAAAVSGGKLTQ
ncbi:MAG: hypothetical protein M3083_14305, partial [Actinomycetota bacterium]|nr:hypothetical protein [Actinomycetota bacterium]